MRLGYDRLGIAKFDSNSILLESLYIDNFKSFKTSKFEFGKLNCLIAPNNTGKSNLIDALKFLDSLIYENTARAISKIGIKNIKNFHYDEKETRLNARFLIKNRVLVADELIDYDVTLLFLFTLNLDEKISNIDILIDGKIKSVVIDKNDLKNGFGLRIFYDIEGYIINNSSYIEELNKKKYRSFHFDHNTTSKNQVIETRFESTHEIVEKLLGLQENKILDFKNIFNKSSLFASHYFHAHDIKRTQESGFGYLLENGTNLTEYLENLREDVFEDISTSLIGEVELVTSIEIKGESIPEVVFNEEVNEQTYPVNIKNISDGTIHFLAIMTAILGNKNAIGMMIEEPERHMHMKVLSYILNTMRDDDKQIFFTTHSTELLSQLKRDEIIFMFRDYAGDTKGIRAKDIENIKKIMKIYKDDLVEMIKIGILDNLEDEL
ncbi:MAG: ATP-binding protein [Sulfurimonas sp.]|uniref:AAA family ATPase n=1 Tax=Sulfurimonas sp. TaxID=2022749 RepID=UPI0028CDAEE4|nr:ATP-binding protein [Sulfurimonas sp.]MDT8337853.1 ATP-binding protein [Sulfurimonas sp.]